MIDVGLVKLILLSLLMVGMVRLFVVVFLGDGQTGPAIGRLMKRLNASSGMGAATKSGASQRRTRSNSEPLRLLDGGRVSRAIRS